MHPNPRRTFKWDGALDHGCYLPWAYGKRSRGTLVLLPNIWMSCCLSLLDCPVHASRSHSPRQSNWACTGDAIPYHICEQAGDEISDRLEDFFDDNDAGSSESDDDTYTENDSHQYSDDDKTSVSDDKTTYSDDDDDPHLPPNDMQDPEVPEGDDDDLHNDPHLPPYETHDPAVPDPRDSLPPVDPDDEEDERNDDANEPDDIPIIDGIEGPLAAIDECERECESDTSSDAPSSEFPPTESEQFEAAEAAGRAVANSHDDGKRDSNHGERHVSTRKRILTRDSALQYLVTECLCNPDHRHKMDEDRRNLPDYNFLTAQMSAKRGLCQFRQKGADALMKELQQLIDQWVMRPCDANILSGVRGKAP